MKREFRKTLHSLILIGIMFFGISLISQGQIQYEEIQNTYGPNFILGVNNGSIALSDLDGDGDEDMIITGNNPVLGPSIRLYINDGGAFTTVEEAPFEGVESSSIAFSDIDGDGDDDVLISGRNIAGEPISNLYTNDGGNFVQVEDTPFEGLEFSSIAFSDVDGDGDEDVLMTGQNIAEEPVSKLYMNDGGYFTLEEDTAFEPVYNGDIAFSDVDDDGDEDVLITGRTSAIYFEVISSLYINDEGSFTLAEDTPFVEVWQSSVGFSDVDGDGDEDLLITGGITMGQGIARLYTNDGGNFTLVQGTPFEDVRKGSMAFADVDNDGDEDVLITGRYVENQRVTSIYSNEGGVFNFVEILPIYRVSLSAVAFSDLDGDGDQDFIITGQSGSVEAVSLMYENLTQPIPTGITEVDDKTFTITPNPTTGLTAIDLTTLRTEQLGLTVFDSNGKVVRKEKLMNSNGKIIMDLSVLENGVYLLSFETKDGDRLTSKLVKTE